jgi:hypothetical protein
MNLPCENNDYAMDKKHQGRCKTYTSLTETGDHSVFYTHFCHERSTILTEI